MEQNYLDPPADHTTTKDASENYEESDVSSQHTHTQVADNSGSHHHQHHHLQEEQKVVAEFEPSNLQDTDDNAVAVSIEAPEKELEKISHHVDDAPGISNGSSASTDNGMMAELAHEQESLNNGSDNNLFKHRRDGDANRSLVDNMARVESVKDAVIKLGGIVDWKAHRAQALERHAQMCFELERIREETAESKKQSETAEMAQVQVQKELESAKQMVEELQMKLERAEKEERQARKDSEFVQLKVKEIEQGIANESSIAARALLNDARGRLDEVVAERRSVEDELKALQGECVLLMNERDIIETKSGNAISAAREIEQRAENLTLELISKRELLESAHVAYLEAEEHRIGAALVRDQDCLAWDNELKQAEEEVQQLNRQLVSTKDLKLKFDSSSALLLKLKAEFEAYIRERSKQESDESINDEEEANGSLSSIRSLALTKKALEELKTSIDQSKSEVDSLSAATSSLKSEICAEKAALTALRQREGMASIVVTSIKAELDRTTQELELIRKKEKESREKIVELPKLLPQAASKADQAKSVARMARDGLRKADKEAEQAKATATTAQMKLHAVLMEIQAAKALEKQALTAIETLRKSEQAANVRDDEHSAAAVTIPFDEYSALRKKANEAEKLAREKVAASLAQIELAEKSELDSIKRLEEAHRKMGRCKEALRVAVGKAEKAKNAKSEAEQELRKWRAELELQRKGANDTPKGSISPSGISSSSLQHHHHHDHQRSESKIIMSKVDPSEHTEHDTIVKKKKKPTFFPRILLFLARRQR